MGKFCTNCGAQLSSDAKFCYNCGKQQDLVESSEISVENQQVLESQPVKEPIETPIYNETNEYCKQNQNNCKNKSFKSILKGGSVIDFIRKCLFTVLALVMFGLSFAPVYSYNFVYNKNDVKISYTAIDGITFMFDSFKSLTTEDLQDSDLAIEIEDLIKEMAEEIFKNGEISSYGENLLNQLCIKEIRLKLQEDTFNTMSIIVINGIFSLGYILLTASFLVLAVLDLLKGNKNKYVSVLAVTSFAFSIILYSTYSFMLKLINASSSTLDSSIGGGTLATLIISGIIFVAISVMRYIANKGKGLQKVNIIPRIVAIALSILVITLSFSSVYSVGVRTLFSERETKTEVSIKVDATLFTDFEITENEDAIESLKALSKASKQEYFENLFNDYGDYTVREVKNGDCDAMTNNIIYLLAASKLVVGVAQVFAIVPILFLLGLIFAAMVLSQNILYFMNGAYNEKFVRTSKTLSLVFALLGFIMSVLFLIIVNNFVSMYMPKGFTVSLASGVILLLVFAIANVICSTKIENK